MKTSFSAITELAISLGIAPDDFPLASPMGFPRPYSLSRPSSSCDVGSSGLMSFATDTPSSRTPVFTG